MPRQAAPWFRNQKGRQTGRWIVTIEGKQYGLPVTDPNDRVGAYRAFQELVARIQNSPELYGPNARAGRPIEALKAEWEKVMSRRVKAGTLSNYMKAVGALCEILPKGGTPAKLTPEAVEEYLGAKGWSANTRSNWIAAVLMFLRWCGIDDFDLKRPRHESRGGESIIPEELQALILKETRGDFHELCRFMWYVGCRPGEALRITVEMVHWKTATVTLDKHKTSDRLGKRVLYLPAQAVAILRAQADRYKSGPVFRSQRGKAFTLGAVVVRFWRLCEKLPKAVTAYHYRHTWATRALEQGMSPAYVAMFLGHVNTKMLHEHYAHLDWNVAILHEQLAKLRN